mmetsp:Transcript_5852/g.13630  ORF Transcript_5852/g.13630 Transcript_5852/m.13630 type:complete len:392 (-) Transcript_5852:1629-2804(-)
MMFHEQIVKPLSLGLSRVHWRWPDLSWLSFSCCFRSDQFGISFACFSLGLLLRLFLRWLNAGLFQCGDDFLLLNTGGDIDNLFLCQGLQLSDGHGRELLYFLDRLRFFAWQVHPLMPLKEFRRVVLHVAGCAEPCFAVVAEENGFCWLLAALAVLRFDDWNLLLFWRLWADANIEASRTRREDFRLFLGGFAAVCFASAFVEESGLGHFGTCHGLCDRNFLLARETLVFEDGRERFEPLVVLSHPADASSHFDNIILLEGPLIVTEVNLFGESATSSSVIARGQIHLLLGGLSHCGCALIGNTGFLEGRHNLAPLEAAHEGDAVEFGECFESGDWNLLQFLRCASLLCYFCPFLAARLGFFDPLGHLLNGFCGQVASEFGLVVQHVSKSGR